MLELIINNKKYWTLIRYAVLTCDSFSVVFEKDYLDNSKYILQDFYSSINEFVISKKNIGKHPDSGTDFENCDLIKIHCCEKTRRILMEATNIFEWNGNERPEELCFYRNEKKWFVCVLHEKLLFLFNETKEDIEFLKREEITYTFLC